MFCVFCHVQLKLQKTARVKFLKKIFFERQEFINHFLLSKLTHRKLHKYVAKQISYKSDIHLTITHIMRALLTLLEVF